MATMHNEAKKTSIGIDFCEAAYLEALHMTKATPSESIVVVGPSYYADAVKLAAKYGARAVLLPAEFMKYDQWLVIGPDASAWSGGA